jgi:nicotinamidase-related amidase
MSDALADLLEFVLAGRPERLTDLAVSDLPGEVRAALGPLTDAVAALGVALGPEKPSAGLRARILASARARLAERPRRAILVCDMINDHLTPGRPLEVPRAREIVSALGDRLDGARAAGVPVVYVLDRHDADDPELDAWGAHAIEGSEGAEVWPALAPRPGDHRVTKTTYSAFHDSELETVLDALAVDTLVLTGCATEIQLMATAADALQRGYAIELPQGAHAGVSEVGERVTAGVLSVLVPYAPARRARLERLRARQSDPSPRT